MCVCVCKFYVYLQCNIFSSLFHRANVQGDLYSGALVKEDVDVMLILNWCLRVYSGKVDSSALLY